MTSGFVLSGKADLVDSTNDDELFATLNFNILIDIHSKGLKVKPRANHDEYEYENNFSGKF